MSFSAPEPTTLLIAGLLPLIRWIWSWSKGPLADPVDPGPDPEPIEHLLGG